MSARVPPVLKSSLFYAVRRAKKTSKITSVGENGRANLGTKEKTAGAAGFSTAARHPARIAVKPLTRDFVDYPVRRCRARGGKNLSS
jgi:hypothetical protein